MIQIPKVFPKLKPCPLCGRDVRVELVTCGRHEERNVITCDHCNLTFDWTTTYHEHVVYDKYGGVKEIIRTRVTPNALEVWNGRAGEDHD